MNKDDYVEDMESELDRLKENLEDEEPEQAVASIRRMNALTQKFQEALNNE